MKALSLSKILVLLLLIALASGCTNTSAIPFSPEVRDNWIFIEDGNAAAIIDTNAETACVDKNVLLGDGNCMPYIDGNASLTDTNVWTENWLDDNNALVNDLNLNNNDIVSVGAIGIGDDSPVFAVEINSGAGLSDWIRVISNGGTRTFMSELDGASLDMALTSASQIPWRFIIGGTPTFDLVPTGSKVNVHVFDELRWYDDEDRDGNYGGLKAYSDLNSSTIWVLPFEDGNNGQAICTDGANQLYFCDMNGGAAGGIADGNVYSLGLLRLDNNVWQINLNTVGDVNGFRLCINGECIDAWADVNFWFDSNIPDTNLYTATLMNPDNNSWIINLVPNLDASFVFVPDRGYSLGLDTNRWLRVNAMSFYTGLLDSQQIETSMFEGVRRCWNCGFQPPPDINYTHSLRKSGFAPSISVPEWQMDIPVNLSGGAGIMLQRNTSFLQSQETTLSGGQTMANIDSTSHKWIEQTVSYPLQTSNTVRSYIHHYGARMDNYNGVTAILNVAPFGCDVIGVAFDEPLPNPDYSVELTGYNSVVEAGFPEPTLYSLHTGATITINTKTINGFAGEAQYTLYDLTTGRIGVNPITGQDAQWCNFATMAADMGIMAVPEELDIDWMVRLYS